MEKSAEAETKIKLRIGGEKVQIAKKKRRNRSKKRGQVEVRQDLTGDLGEQQIFEEIVRFNQRKNKLFK